MGQFYKGTEASFLDDAMFKLPYELMGKAIDKKDKEVEVATEATSALSSLLQAKGLSADDPRLQEIIGGYTNQIQGISSGIYSDAMNAAKYTPQIENLKKQISTDWKMGEVSKIEGNLAAYNAWEEETKKQIDKAGNKISPQQWELLKAKKLAEFKGTGYKNPNTYNTFTGEALLEKKPADEFVDSIFKEKVGSLKSVSWDNEGKQWRVQGERGTAGFTEKELIDAYSSALLADPNQLQALSQLNSLGVPGYQEQLFDEKGLIIDGARPNALLRELDLAKQKYGKVTVKTSKAVSLSEEGKQELAYSIKQRDEEQPVGFTFTDTVKQPLTADYSSYSKTKRNLVISKNSLFTLVANKLDLHTKEERDKLGLQIGSGDYSAFKRIPDGEGYVEQFRDLFAKQHLQNEVEKDYNSWVKGRAKNSKGEVLTTAIVNGKKRTIPANPNTEEGRAKLFSIYSKQPGFQQNIPVNYIADNLSAGIGPKATKAIGKVLGDLKGSLSLNLHTAKNKNTVYTNVNGTTKVKLLLPSEIPPGLRKDKYTDGKMYPVDKNGVFLIPALNSDGTILAQNIVNLHLATDLKYNAPTGETDEDGEMVLGGFSGSKNNLVFKTGTARVVDRNVNNKTVFAMPVSGGDFDVIATLDANTIQQPDLQRYINDPNRQATQKFNDWQTMVPPNLSVASTPLGKIGKSSSKGWYLLNSKTGQKLSPAEGKRTQEELSWAYYNRARQQ